MGGVILPPPGDYTGSTKGGVSQHHNYLLLPKGSSLLPSIFLLIVFFLFLYRCFLNVLFSLYGQDGGVGDYFKGQQLVVNSRA